MAMRVLVVDDDRDMCGMLRMILAQEDCTVVGEAYDGASAVQMCDQLKPDVVLLDIMMSGREDGMGALERILARHPQTRVIMVSALGGREMIDRAFRAGAWDYVVKPFTPLQVRAAVRQAVNSLA
jgi:DNA-binding response OmpR family regulator